MIWYDMIYDMTWHDMMISLHLVVAKHASDIKDSRIDVDEISIQLLTVRPISYRHGSEGLCYLGWAYSSALYCAMWIFLWQDVFRRRDKSCFVCFITKPLWLIFRISLCSQLILRLCHATCVQSRQVLPSLAVGFFGCARIEGWKKQSWVWWVETQSRSLWRHWNDVPFRVNQWLVILT